MVTKGQLVPPQAPAQYVVTNICQQKLTQFHAAVIPSWNTVAQPSSALPCFQGTIVLRP